MKLNYWYSWRICLWGALLIFGKTFGFAQWSTDPAEPLVINYGQAPVSCTDGSGGVFVLTERNLTYPRYLVLDRINRLGYKAWWHSVRLDGEFEEQGRGRVLPDGTGGVYVLYEDRHAVIDGHSLEILQQVRLQHIDSLGNMSWESKGKTLPHSSQHAIAVGLCTDDSGGAIIAWRDSTSDLSIQRIARTGDFLWPGVGVVVPVASNTIGSLISDSKGGVIVYPSYHRLYRIGPSGDVLWGRTIEFDVAMMVTDFQGGAFMAGIGYVGFVNGEIITRATCQHVDSTGLPLWGTEGELLEDSLRTIGNSANFITLYNQGSFLLVTWTKRLTTTNDLYSVIQKIRFDGSLFFPTPWRYEDSAIVMTHFFASQNNTILVLGGTRDTTRPIVTRLIDTSLNQLWNPSVRKIRSGGEFSYDGTSDGNGGVIVTGFDSRDFSIWAQQSSARGNLGIIEGASVEGFAMPMEDRLFNNYPNPFNASTTIQFELAKNCNVGVAAWNVLGQNVGTFFRGPMIAGRHELTFDFTRFPSGLYFVTITTGLRNFSMKINLIK